MMRQPSSARPPLFPLLAGVGIAVLAAGCGTSSGPSASTSPSAAASAAPSASGPVSLAAAAPSGIKNPANFGDQVQVAVPKAGAPVVAYTWIDAHDKGSAAPGDDQLLSVAFDPASRTWGAPVTIVDAPMEHHSSSSSIAMAADAASNTVAVAYEDQNPDSSSKGIKLAFSVDGGKSWTPSTVSATAGSTFPAIAMGGGKVYVAYTVGDVESVTVSQATLPLSGTTRWTQSNAPRIGSADLVHFAPAIALDSTGAPYLAYHLAGDSGGVTIGVWKVGSATAVKVFDSDGVQNDFASVGIAFKGTTAVVTSSLDRSNNGDDSVIFWEVTSTDGGKTWSAGTKVPPDKGESSPFGVSMAANSSEVLLTYVPNSGSGAATCGTPKLAESSDLTTWKTCSPEGGPAPAVASGFHPGAASGPDGTLYVGFNNSDPAGVPAGVLLWTKPA